MCRRRPPPPWPAWRTAAGARPQRPGTAVRKAFFSCGPHPFKRIAGTPRTALILPREDGKKVYTFLYYFTTRKPPRQARRAEQRGRQDGRRPPPPRSPSARRLLFSFFFSRARKKTLLRYFSFSNSFSYSTSISTSYSISTSFLLSLCFRFASALLPLCFASALLCSALTQKQLCQLEIL